MKEITKWIVNHPLHCWDIVLMQRTEYKWKKEFESLFDFQSTYNWTINLQKILLQPIDAVVVTDITQTIVWVSSGFEKMTGYSKAFAVNKRPSFLQGRDTSITVRNLFRENISQQKYASGTLVNYRKDGTPYVCSIQIFPAFNPKNQLKHFIALEREIKNL